MTYAQCGICIAPRPFECFRFMPCGHGFCNSCIDALAQAARRRMYNCPVCRRQVRAGQEVKIHVEFPDGNDSSAAIVEDELSSLHTGSNADDVTKATNTMEGLVAGGSNMTKEKLDSILDCISDFKERIIPTFELCHTQKQQVAALRVELSKSSQDYQKLLVQLREKEKLKEELEKAQVGWRKAFDKAKTERDIATKSMQLLEEAAEQFEVAKEGKANLEKRLAEEQSTTKDLRRLLQRQAHDLQRSADKINNLQTQLGAATHELDTLKQEKEEHTCTQSSDDVLLEYDGWSEHHRPYETPSTSRFPDSTPHWDSTPVHRSKHRRTSQALDHHTPAAMTPISFDPKDFFEGLPRPGFGSEWNLQNPGSKATRGVKRKAADENVVPFQLDRNGKPLSAVQLGPKRSVRVHLK